MDILLRGGASRRLAVDADLWIGALDLALGQGWNPTAKPGGEGYCSPAGQRIDGSEAKELARLVDLALDDVSDSVQPMQGHPFGEEHTAALIARIHAGGHVGRKDVTAAYEILSGSPKPQLRELVKFLRRGGFVLESPSESPAGSSRGPASQG